MKKLNTFKEFNAGPTNEAGPIGDKGVTGIPEATVINPEDMPSRKGTDLGKSTVAGLRKKMRKLSEQELDDFIEEIAFAFDLIKKY